MADFSLTSALKLQKPGNLDQISNLIRSKLENINVKVNVGTNPSQLAAVNTLNKNLRTTAKSGSQAADSMEAFGKQTAITIRRFGAYTLATAGFFKFVRSVNQGIREAIEFQDQLIKISQVTGESLFSLRALTNEIDRLSTSFGVSSKELLNASQVLAQAGLNARDVRVALQALAKSDLAPTFDNINKTAEASIAILRQFGLGVGQLEGKLSSINAVSAKFAVESGDITSAIQRTGGAFAAAGGSLEQLVGLFTSVRATTRESADSIATGFRTIFTRIQRTRTQNSLKDLGVDLRNFGDDARKLGKEGLFVGPFKAIENLSNALNQLESSDPRFAQIVEELGGFRQISKVIPLIQEFSTAENALGVALRGTNSLTEDAEKRQESLAIQIKKVAEEFQVLLRQFGNSATFQYTSRIILELTKQLVQLGKVLEGLAIPIALVFGNIAARGSINFIRGLGQQASSTKVQGFSLGGKIPGFRNGNKDTEIIATTPGEFVIQTKSVDKYGADFLDKLNRGVIPKSVPGFAKGGMIGSSIPKFAAGGAVGKGLAVTAVVAGSALSQDFNNLSKETKGIITLLTIFGLQFFALNSILKNANPNLSRLNSVVDGLGKKIEKRESALSSDKTNLGQFEKDASKRLNDLNRTVVRSEFDGSPLKRLRGLDRERNLITADYVSAQRTLSKLTFGDENVAKNTELENVFKERIKEVDKRKGVIEKDLSRGAAAKEEIKTINKSVEKRREEISQQEKDLQNSKKLQKEYERQAKLINGLNIGIAAAAAGLTAFGSFLSQRGQDELTKLRGGEAIDVDAARKNVVRGETLSGAGVGAVAGLGLLNFASSMVKITPQIAIATTAFSILSAAIYKNRSAQEEFRKQLKSIDIEKASVNISNRLSDLQNNVSPRIVGGSLNRDIEKITSALAVDTDQETKTSLKATLDASVSGLLDFVKKTQAISSSIEGFRAVVSDNTLQLIADKTGKNLNEYVASIQEAIKKNTEFAAGLDESIKRQRDFEIGILSQRALNTAAQSAADNLENFSTGLNQVISEAGLSFGSGISGVFNQIASGTADGGSESALNGFAANFGDAAGKLSRDSLDAARAIELLPNALLDIRAKDPLGGGTGAFADRLAVLLDNASIGPAIKNSILDQVNAIIGPEGQDVSIVQRINKDFIGVIEEISKGITERNKDIFTSLEGSTLKALKNFGDGLEDARKNLQEITDKRIAIVDNAQFLQSIRSGITGRDDFAAQRNIESRRTSVITGGRTSAQLLNTVSSSQENEIRLRDELSRTQELAKRKDIISSINAEQAARDKAKRGLEFLADVSNRTAVAQKQLEEATRDRSTKRDLAIQSVFATPQERARESLVVGQARLAASAQNVNVIPMQLRQEVLSFLQRLGDTKLEGLGGLSGNQTINRIVGRELDAAGVGRQGILEPGKREKELFNEIKLGVENANKIQEGLIKLQSDNNNRLVADLGNQFDTFINDLKGQISQIFDRERQTRGLSIRGDIEAAGIQDVAGKRISEITGADAQTVFNSFKQISELAKRTTVADSSKETISSLLTNTDAFRKAVSVSSTKEGKLEGGEGLLRNLFSQIEDKSTLDTLNKTLREGGFSSIIGSLTTELSKTTFSTQDDTARKFQNSLETPLKNILKNLEQEITSISIDRSSVASSVGGEENLKSIISNLSALEPIIKGLPDNVAFDKLENTIDLLRRQLNVIDPPKPIERNSGGRVGFGRSKKDTIPAMLADGEYVIQSSAVSKYGLGFLDQVNKGMLEERNSGGLLGKLMSGNIEGRRKKKKLWLEGIDTINQKIFGDGLPFTGNSVDRGNFTGLEGDTARDLQLERARKASQDVHRFNRVDIGDGGLGRNYYEEEVKRINEESKKKTAVTNSFIERMIPEKGSPSDINPKMLDVEQSSIARNGFGSITQTKSKTASVETITKKQIENFVKKYNFPESIMSDLVGSGVTIKRGESLTDIDKGLLTQSPRGHSSSFEDIKGLYRAATKEVFLRNNAKLEVAAHELGHAFDSFKGNISNQDDFKAAYGSDIQRMTDSQKIRASYLLQDGSAGRQEAFASIFDNIVRKRNSSGNVFPLTTNLVSDLMKKSEIEHFHNDYKEIVKMRQVPNPDYGMLLEKIKSSKSKMQTSLVKDDPRVLEFLNQLNTAESLYSNRTGFNNGGRVGFGRSKKDTIPAMLADGEYVIQSSAVSKYGLGFLDQVNKGRLEERNSGGLLGKRMSGNIEGGRKKKKELISFGKLWLEGIDIINQKTFGDRQNQQAKDIGVKTQSRVIKSLGLPPQNINFTRRIRERENPGSTTPIRTSPIKVDRTNETQDQIAERFRNQDIAMRQKAEQDAIKFSSGNDPISTQFPREASKYMSDAEVAKTMKNILPQAPKKSSPPIQNSGFSQEELNRIASGEASGSPPIIDYQKIARDKRAAAIKREKSLNKNNANNIPNTTFNNVPLNSPQNPLRGVRGKPNVPSGAAAIGQPVTTQPQIDTASITSLNAAMGQFNTTATALAKAISTIPTTISLTGNHRVEVVLNGAQVLAEMQPAIQKMIIAASNNQLNNFITQKFPEVGPMVV